MSSYKEDFRSTGADDNSGAVGFGYSSPGWKKNFHGAETSSSSMNFISFTKAGTHLDGSQSSAKNDYEAKKVCVDVSKLELVGHISRGEIMEAQTLVERIHVNLKRIINDPVNRNNSLTTNFSNSIQVSEIFLQLLAGTRVYTLSLSFSLQVLKLNPVYLYTCLRDVNIDNIPPGFKTNFYGKGYDGGYLCEVRVKVKQGCRV